MGIGRKRVARAFSSLAVCLALFALTPLSARAAQDGAPPPLAAGDELTISLLTFGPGDHAFFKFGHAALLVEDARRHTRLVFNYGTFSFDSLWLVPRFLTGKYHYWLSVRGLDATLRAYAAENRSVVAQRLHLSAEQKRQTAAFLAWNALDENKYYLFDYYADNCATRLRDLIDRASGGALRAAAGAPAEMTWRGHTRRLSADDLPVYLGLHVAMGSYIDQPITAWEEMFLPAKLKQTLAAATVDGPLGREPLVEEEIELVRADRAPLRVAPPAWTGRMALAGAGMGLAFAALGVAASRGRRWARWALAASLSACGLFSGILGLLFVFLWAFTNHAVAYHNENVLQLAPLGLLLLGPAAGFARGRPAAARRAAVIAAAMLVASTLGLALKLTPWLRQDNAEIIALAWPVWLGLAAATHLSRRAYARESAVVPIEAARPTP